jgi:hypothetical protein
MQAWLLEFSAVFASVFGPSRRYKNLSRVHIQKELISDLNRFPFFVKEIRRGIE